MISTVLISVLILIPTIPLILYTIGVFVPKSHIVSRSIEYNTSAEILWAILTSVRDYPAWRSNIDRVTVRSDDFESDINKYEDESRITFVEYNKKDCRTVVMHIEQEKERKLLRVLEERPYIAPGEDVPKRKSTFSGSWSFEIKPSEGEDKMVTLKITEQGEIHKPMVRVSHMLFFGYHRRIDRFMKDLGKEIELGILEQDIEEEEEEEEGLQYEKEDIQEEEVEEYEAGPDDSVVQPAIATSNLTESRYLEKDWDMMSEVYENKAN
ncbi:unnamed protein product [Mucor hiemalis]